MQEWKGPSAAVLEAFLLLPSPRTAGLMASKRLAHLKGHAGIQVRDYGAGSLGKDPELSQTST